MALLSTTAVIINGKTLPHYNTFSLQQELGEHHSLELYCYASNLKTFCNSDTFNDLLGNVIAIEITPIANLNYYKTLQFKGIITGIEQKQGMLSGEGERITIKAKSPTVLAENGKHFASYTDEGFIDIITRNFRDYDASKLKVNTKNSRLNEPIPYTVQNNESNFEFAKHLAARYGEWMYYNGLELIFGLDATDTINLELGRDLKEYSTTMQPLAQNIFFCTNDYLTDTIQEQESSAIRDINQYPINTINQIANFLYTNQSVVWLNTQDNENAKRKLDEAAKAQKGALQTKQFTVKGISDNPGVNLGNIIAIKGGGRYRVVKVSHDYFSNGEYQNTFEAIDATIQTYPKTDVSYFPEAQPQTAVVIDNNDPEGLSRIKVQCHWQKREGLKSPWIRMLSPHGGSEKGFHFIPEKGEEVLIGFEGGNAERPYFMGSLYNSKAKASGWKTKTNNIKAIQTRSGNKVIMNDENGSITIADPSGNTIVMNGGGNITINAPNTLTFNATDIKMNAGNSITINSKPNEEDENSTGEGTINVTAKKLIDVKTEEETITFTAEQDFKAESKQATIDLKAKTDAVIKASENTNIDGDTSLNLDGDKINITGGSNIKIESSDTDIF